jgi:tetratricopeptide (TPR) repeat protein
MIRRVMPGFLALTFALAPFAPARAAEGDAVARAVAGSEAEAKGDFETWLGELVGAVARAPESPFAMAALTKAEAVMASARDPSVVEKALETTLSRGVADGEMDEKLRDVLAGRARARGDFDKARAYQQNRGYVRRFAVAGPFGDPTSANVHRRFGPESRDLDPAAAMEAKWGSVKWLPIPLLGDDPWIAPNSQVRRDQGVMYALARLKTAAARTVALKVVCRDSFAVFVDGRRAILADRERDAVPDEVWTTTRLEAGWNRLLVKVAGSGAFAFKLCDPTTGLPVLDVEEGDPLGGAESPESTGDAEPLAYHGPPERALAASTSDAAASTLAAALCDDVGRDWDAYLAHEAAAAAVSESEGALAANVRAAYGRFLLNFRELPEVERKTRAKAQFEAATKAYATHNSAKVRLAEFENDEDHPDRAVKSLREQIKAQPTPTAWMSLARIAAKRGWEKEAIDAAEKTLELAPNHVEAIRFLLDFDRKYGNAAQVGARTKRLLEIDAGDGAASGDVVGQLRAQGRHEEALQLVRTYAARWPAALNWRSSEAGLLSALGREDEALAAWRALAELVPQEPAYPRAIAAILEGKGDTAGAIEHYNRSLALEPFQPPVWRDLGRLVGDDADYGAPYEPDVKELLAQLPSTEELKKKHPKAIAITVLDHDVVRVRPDGSAQSWIHMIWKLLDEKAVKKYATVSSGGGSELLAARAILPDGRVMEPTGLPGRTLNMEGLVPGTIVEHRYLQFHRATPKGYDGGLFLFQDADFHEEPNPVLLSRLVVMSPESVKLDPVKRNYDGEPNVETKSGYTVTTWEKRDMPRIEPERYMPDSQEIVPHVDYSRPTTYDDVNWDLLQQRDNTRPTPILLDAVRKVVKDGMSDVEKLRALYDFVNDEITGDFGGNEGPTATLLAKAGDRGRLFAALVRAAGVPFQNGRAMWWNGEGRLGPVTFDASLFNAPFLLLEPRGADPIPFVMLGRLAPFGLLPDGYRGSAAYVPTESGGRIVRLPDGGPDVQNSTTFEIRLGADEKATKVSGVVHYRDAQRYEWKREVMETPQDDRRKWAERQINRYFASPSLEKFAFPDLEKRGVPFELQVEGTMENYVVPQGGSLVVALGLPRIGMAQRFVERAERTYDLVLNVREDLVDDFTIVLSDAFRVKTLPEDHVVFHRLGTYSLTWRDLGDRIVVRREAHLAPTRCRADEYKSFVAWCKSIDDAEERKLELRRAK